MFNYNPAQQPLQSQNQGFNTYMVQQTQTAQMAQIIVLYTPTAKDFSSVTIQPNRQALIIAQNEPFMAHKVADGMGMVRTSLYKLIPIAEKDMEDPKPEYITKVEFAQLQNVVQEIVKRMQGEAKE